MWGIRLNNWLALITHQQFLDRTILMGDPSVQEALAFKRILNDFMLASSIEIEPNKSQDLFFNTHPSI